VVRVAAASRPLTFAYPDEASLAEKIESVARRIYHASGASYGPGVAKQLKGFAEAGYGHLPVCIAKTPYSFSTDAERRGAPVDHVLHIREVRLSAGAGFVVAISGDVMTMPGLPAHPASEHIDIDELGNITGIS
jgi:formate--tetrahydrofolate ligase